MDRQALLLLCIILMSQHMYARTIIQATTCSCNLMGTSKESCTVEEIFETYPSFERSEDHPNKVQNLTVEKWEPCMDKLYLNLTWLGPEGVSLTYTRGFVLELDLGMEMQKLRIPVNTTPKSTSGTVNWTVTCQFDPSAYKKKQDLYINVYPLPIAKKVEDTVKMYKFTEIPISKDIVQGNAENAEWEPVLSVRSTAKNLLQINFTVPEELRTTMTTFNISLEPSLGGPEISKTNGGRFTFTSKARPEPNTCYNITLSKVCNTCDGGFTDCVNSKTIKISKMWNGSNCSDAIAPELNQPKLSKIQESKTAKPKIALWFVFGIIVTIIAVFALAGVIFIGYQRMHNNDEDVAEVVIEPSKADRNDQLENLSKDTSQLRKRKILIIYSDDNEPHKKVVKAFATYLQAHCMCEVFLDVWDEVEVSRDILSWYLRKAESADRIIMIHSEGGWHKAKKNQPLNGDRFSMMLPIVRNLKKKGENDKFLMVCFSYTDVKFIIDDLSFGYNFVIPKHLEDLVLHIHDMQKYAYGTVISLDSVKEENYHLEKKGDDLRVSIANAENYMKQKPHSSGVSQDNANLPSVNSDTVVDSGFSEDLREINEVIRHTT